MAYAAARFADACLRAQAGEGGVVECAYVASSLVAGLPFFASQLRLGPEGIAGTRVGVGGKRVILWGWGKWNVLSAELELLTESPVTSCLPFPPHHHSTHTHTPPVLRSVPAAAAPQWAGAGELCCHEGGAAVQHPKGGGVHAEVTGRLPVYNSRRGTPICVAQ